MPLYSTVLMVFANFCGKRKQNPKLKSSVLKNQKKLTFEDNLSALFGATEVCGPLQLDYIECVGCETVVTITDLDDVSGV